MVICLDRKPTQLVSNALLMNPIFIRPLVIPIIASIEQVAAFYFIKAVGSLKICFIKTATITSEESPKPDFHLISPVFS
jgi:hypothetical protein